MAETVVVPKPVAVPVPTVAPTVAERMRAQLAQAVRSIWATPEAQQMRSALTEASKPWADALRSLFETTGLKREFERLAAQVDLSGRYRRIWGKP